jgi:hypothetical protein
MENLIQDRRFYAVPELIAFLLYTFKKNYSPN